MSTGISAIVLAAGDSSRMGELNKLLLPFNSKTIIETVVDKLEAADVDEVIVVLGFEAQQIRNKLKNRAVQFVDNTGYRNGMTSSIQTGVSTASESSAGYLICLADMPLLTPQDYKRIINEFKLGQKWIVKPTFQGQSGNPIMFSANFKKEILEHKDPDGCRKIVQQFKEFVNTIEFTDDRVLRDIDTPDDYSSYEV